MQPCVRLRQVFAVCTRLSDASNEYQITYMFIILTTAILNMMTAQGLTLYALVVCFGRLPRGDRQIFQNKIGEWALLTRYNQCAGKNDFYSHCDTPTHLAPTPLNFIFCSLYTYLGALKFVIGAACTRPENLVGFTVLLVALLFNGGA